MLLGVACLLLVVTERTMVARLGDAISLGPSGILGVLALHIPVGGVVPAGNMFTPLFAGLFGAPMLIEALDGEGVPPQADSRLTVPRRFLFDVGFAGTLCGAIVGYLPGISAAIAAGTAMVVVPQRGPRAFVVATSGVSTANTVFALFALVALGTPRTGVLVAIDRSGVPHNLPILLGSIAIAAAVAFLLVLTVGDWYLDVVGSLDNVALSVGALLFLCVLVGALTGLVGLGVFAAATVVGLVPARFGARRMTLIGVLLVPLAL